MLTFQTVPGCVMHNTDDCQGFDAMVGAYKTSGGTVRADDLALLMEHTNQGNFVSVVRRIASRDIFSFEWHNHFWVPMFQFNPDDLTPKHEVRRVVHELSAVLDSWTLALWFTEPNDWLKGQRPVDRVDGHFQDVLHAARADRYVAAG